MEINGDKPALYAQYIQAEAERLVKVAAIYGVVLTIEQKPLEPLAMGHYESVVAVRQAVRKKQHCAHGTI